MKHQRNNLLNTYVQGSVWTWQNGSFENKPGVQSSGRPVLIISNNTFNQHSPVVNCLTITSKIGRVNESPVHVHLMLDVSSNIQCEQIHTINKNELIEYRGAVTPATLSTVKGKLSYQFDINADRNWEAINSLTHGFDELSARIDTILELPILKPEMGETLEDIKINFVRLVTNLTKMQTTSNKEADKPDAADAIEQPKEADNAPHADGQPAKKTKRTYTKEDIQFILDDTNSLSDIVARFGYEKRIEASRIRTYFKRRPDAVNKAKSAAEYDAGKASKTGKRKPKAKGRHRTYSEEDIRFILDKSNPLANVAKKFGYKDNTTASKMRSYFKTKAKGQNPAPM